MKLFVLSLLAGATALDFQGTGQLRALQGVPEGDERGTDLGCLTVEGKWTVDEARCGLFSGARKDNLTITVTTLAGIPCGHDPGTFVCREGLTAASTMWMLFFGGIPVFPGRDILGAGQYGLFASNEDYVPEKASDDPVSISYYSGSEPQPYIYLGWQAR